MEAFGWGFFLKPDTPTGTDYLAVSEKSRVDNGGYQDKDGDDIDLDPGEMRRYQIRAVNSANLTDGDNTTTVSADDRTDEDAPATEDGWVRAQAKTVDATAPTPPSGLTAVNTTTTANAVVGDIDLYWFAPELENNGGWDVTDYLIQVRRVDDDWPDIPDADDLKTLEAVGKGAGEITADGATFRIALDDTYTATQKTFTDVPNTWDHDGDENATPAVLPADQTPPGATEA